MMKLFRIETENVAYDEDISMVILAESKESAINIANTNWKCRDDDKIDNFNIIEIDQSVEQIVDVSHYGE